MEKLDKQKLIIALQSKINLLSKKSREALEKKEYCVNIEISAKIEAYMEIESAIIKGNFDS